MKIAFCSPHSDPLAEPGEPDSGGQCVYEQRLAAALAAIQEGGEVGTYTRRWGGKPRHCSFSERAWVARIEIAGHRFIRKEELAPYLPGFVEAMWHRHGDWLDQASLFHGHYWDGGVTALLASLRTGRPLLFTAHSLGREKRDRIPEDGSLNYAVRIPAEHRVMAAADRIVALTTIEKETLQRRYSVDPEKIVVVPGGVDTTVYRPTGDPEAVRAELGLEPDEFMVFTPGRLDPRKGYDLLLKAIPTIQRRLRVRGQRARFLLPGGGDQLSDSERAIRSTMEALIQEQEVYDSVILFPHLAFEQLLAYYTAADLCVVPSPYEPFGLVVVEAFACGTPVVATCHGGPPEIIDEGVNGYLVDPTEPEAWARVIDKLFQEPANLQAMGESGRTKAFRVFDWHAVARAVFEVYETLLRTE